MLQKKDLITIRPATLGDKNFIFATWLRGLRHGNDWFQSIDSDIFFKNYHLAIEHIIARPTTNVAVACLRDEPEVILGYSVFDKDRLHWVFVKKSWRNIGIARSLTPTTITSVTHLTKVGKSLLSKLPNVVFNPFNI